FIELREIDPVYFEHSYYLVPDKGGQKAYALLRQAMEQAKRVALGRVVMRGREYLTAIRAAGPVLVMSTLYYADEVVSVAELEGLPGETVQATEREVAMAQQLIEALAAPFEPEKYRDEYREAVLQLIEEKAAGKTVVPMAPKRAEAAPPVDLVKALEESIALAKERAKRTA
ncbi:MAG: Ku protein, partial [Chloroflexota bacterium]|nr:Ku protein [Chloroflexota bacterium]